MRSVRRVATESGLLLAGIAMLTTGSRVVAAPMTLEANQNPALTSAFTLDFSPFGGISSANITSTEFELEIDPATETARFLSYNQFVDPLLIPDGQGGAISTGDIRVEIIDSISGTFDRATGTFVTEDVYAVHFDGDLSAFGITSPFVLPSTSTGRVEFSNLAGGTTEMEWVGTGQLALLPFTYACSVHGVFTTNVASGYIATSFPDSGAIDARQPHAPADAAMTYGWDSIEVTLNGVPLAALTTADFAVDGVSQEGLSLNIAAINPIDDRSFELVLDGILQPGTWAVLSHPASTTSVCLGYLPGDVSGDGFSSARDITALVNSLNQVPGRERPIWSTDLDRDGVSNAQDITRLIDVLNGAGAFDRWLGARLDASPCS